MTKKINENQFNQQMLNFLQQSPSPFHAVQSIKNELLAHDFTELSEADNWQLQSEKKYFVIRNGSSIIAFTMGKNGFEQGFNMLGAHTDSPCLKVKPNPDKNQQGYFQLGVEVYGGALLNPWFDRDLSLAGRVTYEDSNGKIKSCSIDFETPIAIIPSLAIHLDREANENRTINKQKHLPPILLQIDTDEEIAFNDILFQELSSDKYSCSIKQIFDYELFFYDTQKPSIMGLNQQFIASARLDNLLSCFTGLKALVNACDNDQSNLLVCSDHEEVGSASSCGAESPFLKSVLERICGNATDLTRCLDRSIMISADNAHGIHPNYQDKHDENHGPILNKGPVIKSNANQRYATNSETSAMFRYMCQQTDVPFQAFVVRSDTGCGSTIGPITASTLGVKTLDVGVPTFAMHSVRELAGAKDGYYLYKVLNYFFRNTGLI